MGVDQYTIINSSIADNRCLLFLGPKFAITKEKKKVHSELFTWLSTVYNLDPAFDNLFIIKDPQPEVDKIMALRIVINSFYDDVVPHEVYQKIASLRFRAVISCTHDLFLPNAFSDKWETPANFKYFSRKPVPGEAEKQPENLPLYYNVFGSVKDKQSLISSYDTFYDFLIKLISNEPKVPQELQTCLNQASVIVLLGFDLTKWYMPLLFRKLKEYIGRKDSDDKIIAYVSTEDSADGPEVSDYYLKHFAVKVNSLNTDAVSFIDELCKNNKSLLKLQKAASAYRFENIQAAVADGNTEICTHLNEAIDLVADADIRRAIELLKTSFQYIKDEHARMIKFKATFSQVVNDYYDTLDKGARDSKLAELRSAFIDYCNGKISEINCQ